VRFTKDDDKILSELQRIEKLMIVLLAKLGSTSDEIGQALGLAPSVFRSAISFSKIKRIKSL